MPVTAIITAAALVAAVLERRDAVVLSNEWSASVPTLVAEGIAVNHQWSKGEEFERAFGDLVLATLGPGISVFSYLRPRSELWVSQQFARLTQLPPRLPQLQPRLPPGPGANGSTTGAAAATSAASSTSSSPRSWTASSSTPSSPATSPWRTRPTRSGSGRCSGWAPAPSRSSASGTSTSAAPPPLLAAQRADRAGTVLLARLRAELAERHDRRPRCPASQPRGPPPHPGPLCASRSPGPRSLTRPSASGGSASRDGPASAACGPWAATPVLVDDAPASAAIDGLEVLATDAGGLDALRRCDVVVKSPGISRYRPEVAQLEAAGVAVCGGLGLFMAEADPTRVACITGTKGKSTTTALAVHLLNGLGDRARAGGNIGHPPWDPAGEPAPDYWIVETSSFQVPDLADAPAGGRRHLAVAGPSRLARDGRALLRRQALAVHQARRGTGPRRRHRRGAARRRPGCSGRTSAG